MIHWSFWLLFILTFYLNTGNGNCMVSLFDKAELASLIRPNLSMYRCTSEYRPCSEYQLSSNYFPVILLCPWISTWRMEVHVGTHAVTSCGHAGCRKWQPEAPASVKRLPTGKGMKLTRASGALMSDRPGDRRFCDCLGTCFDGTWNSTSGTPAPCIPVYTSAVKS